MNLVYRIYFGLPDFSRIGLLGKAINKTIRILLKRIFDLFIIHYLKRTADKVGFGLNTFPRNEKYIVSLTSFPDRINEIWICIETILRQSFKPDKIILWLADNQFPDHKLPDNLVKLLNRGLSIEYCPEDLKSHKKYFYAMEKYPDANIITVDDDLYYDDYLLENLVQLHRNFPSMIVTNRAHKILVDDKNKKLRPYKEWKPNVTEIEPSLLLFPTSGAGTLFPPGVFSSEVLNKKVFKEKCFFADDIWLKIMSLMNGISVVTNKKYNKDFISVGTTQNNKLVTGNVSNNGNDRQIMEVVSYYNIDIYNIIRGNI